MWFGATPWKLARWSLWCQRCAFYCSSEKKKKKISQIWPRYKLLKKIKKISVFIYLAEPWQVILLKSLSAPNPPAAASRCCPGQPHSNPLARPRLFSSPAELSTTLQPRLPFLDAVGCCRGGSRAGFCLSSPHRRARAEQERSQPSWDGSWRCQREDRDVLGMEHPRKGRAMGAGCAGSRARIRHQRGRVRQEKKVLLQFTTSRPDFCLIDSYWKTALSLVQIQEALGLRLFLRPPWICEPAWFC